MDRYFPTVLAGLLLVNIPLASAGSQTEVKVTGWITPQACMTGLSDGGTVDHGNIAVRDLNQDKNTLLPRSTLRLSVQCKGATFFALTTIDNRHGSSVIPNHHGLGTTPNDENLGSVSLSLSNPVADGAAVRTLMSLDNGGSWFTGTVLGHSNLLAIASVDNISQPMAVTAFDADITFYTRIARADGLTVAGRVPINGHMTIELRYR